MSSNKMIKVTIAALEGEASDTQVAEWLADGAIPPEAYKHILKRGHFATTHILNDPETSEDILLALYQASEEHWLSVLAHPKVSRELADTIIYSSSGYMRGTGFEYVMNTFDLIMTALRNFKLPYNSLQTILSYEGEDDYVVHYQAGLQLAALCKAEEDERIAQEQQDADKHYDNEVSDLEAAYEARLQEMRDAAAWSGE